MAGNKDPRYEAYCLEADAEKMRQLYVAMTRAKLRLYSPVAIVPKVKTIALGCASPMDLLLGRLGQPLIDPVGLYSRIQGYNGETLRNFLDHLTKEVSIFLHVVKYNPLYPLLC